MMKSNIRNQFFLKLFFCSIFENQTLILIFFTLKNKIDGRGAFFLEHVLGIPSPPFFILSFIFLSYLILYNKHYIGCINLGIKKKMEV